MRVLFLSAGNSTHTARWVNALAERGHEVFLVFNKGHEPQKDHINRNVRLIRLPFGGNKGYYLNAISLQKAVKKLRPDVINAHYASGYGTLARIAKLRPLLLSVWGSDVYEFPYENKLKKRILIKNIKHASRVMSTSQCMAEELKRVVADNNIQVDITPFGVDINTFDPDKYEDRESKETITIGNIKLIEPNYGIKELILIAESLQKELVNTKSNKKLQVALYGDGSQRQELESLVREKNLQNMIKFYGRIENSRVPEALSKIDIFCALSKKESFGVAVVEAMSMKIPVVVSQAAGFKEVVEDSVTGFIVDREDKRACKDILKRLIEDDNLRGEIGQNGRKRVIELYNWEENVSKMEKIYVDMINSNRV